MTRLAAQVRHRLRRLSSLRRDDLLALWWAVTALRTARREVGRHGTRATVPPPPAGLSLWAGHRVARYLEIRKATCLQRCLVLQAWLVAHDRPVAVVIGVGTKDDGFAAHAWLPGYDPESESAPYREISRIEPRAA